MLNIIKAMKHQWRMRDFMVRLALAFLMASLLSAFIGFSGIATTGIIGAFSAVAQFLFFIFFIFFVAVLLVGRALFA